MDRNDNNWSYDDIPQPKKPSLLQQIYKMVNEYDNSDVQIQINENIYNCHMIVLQSYAKFFHGKTMERLVVLPADKVTPLAFIIVYDWMLADNPKVERQGILQVFNAAEYLGIEALISQCWAVLDDDICFAEEGAFELYRESQELGLEQFQHLYLGRICKYFLELVASEDFVQFSVKDLCLLFDSNWLGVHTEAEIFMAAVRWLAHDWIGRQGQLLDVMKCVRFLLMTPLQLIELGNDRAEEMQQVVQNQDIKDMISMGLRYISNRF